MSEAMGEAPERGPFFTHSYTPFPWGIPADETLLRLGGVKDFEIYLDDEDRIHGKITVGSEGLAEAIADRLIAYGWHFDEEESAWVK